MTARVDPNSAYFKFDTYNFNSFDWLDYDQTSAIAMKAMLECFVGKKLGEGVSRTVFECKFNPDYVVKVSTSYDTQNPTEHRTWQRFKDVPKVAKWLAPVDQISACGRVIVQRRTRPLLRPPTTIPNFLGDLKVQNFGMIDGKCVAHDFGLGIFINGDEPIQMVKPSWWDGLSGDHYG
jgi:hypothetical protein